METVLTCISAQGHQEKQKGQIACCCVACLADMFSLPQHAFAKHFKLTAVYTNDRAVWMQQMALLALQLMRLCCMSELSISDKLLECIWWIYKNRWFSMSSTSTGFATVSVLLVIVMIRHAVHISRKNHQWMNQFQRNEKNQKRLCSADGWWPTRSFLFSTCWMRQFHECSRNDLTVTKLRHDRFGRDMRLFIDFACGWTLFVDTMGHAPC